MSSMAILLIIAFVVMRYVGEAKKQREQAEKQRRARAAAAEAASPRQEPPARGKARPSPKPSIEPRVKPLSEASGGSMGYASGEGRAFGGSLSGEKREWKGPVAPRVDGTSQVAAEGGAYANAGQESAYSIRRSGAGAWQFAFDRSSLQKGLLYGEILGKPRALRKK